MLSWKIRTFLLFLVCLASGLTHFRKLPLDTVTGTLNYRALPNAPNGYTSEKVQCPSHGSNVRITVNISEHEMHWLQKRQNKGLKGMQTFLTRMKIRTSMLPNILQRLRTHLCPTSGSHSQEAATELCSTELEHLLHLMIEQENRLHQAI
ncbi:lysophospholipase catalytic domain-containing protein [Penicillium cataractarum]|uniref:Lysophospholipase catalytic domain-containing protein n=1 Tax=Penicillium cataractarum TaxID=2100454 RepID=A0A9W9SQ47_9EURO|nr:lysophospholipase catalytic domain-containing protein [Penicillium cataractarum]KAJ5382065.1 lysophospholipase catalytic domain-containing protein [Penicillium cataractarum]